eukprot:5773298-Pyramimonas_sp.AAC.1
MPPSSTTECPRRRVQARVMELVNRDRQSDVPTAQDVIFPRLATWGPGVSRGDVLLALVRIKQRALYWVEHNQEIQAVHP